MTENKKSKSEWSEEDDNFLRENHEKMTVKEMAELLDATYDSVYNRCYVLGLTKSPNWSEEEDNFLKENYDKITHKEMAEELNRSVGSTYVRLYTLGLEEVQQSHRKWTQEEDDFLKENYKKMSIKELMEKLNRSESSIYGRFYTLDLKKVQQSHRKWTEEEEKFVKSEFGRLTLKEMAEILGRTELAIQARCFELGLRKKPQFEGDSETHKTCRYCFRVLPKTEEFFRKSKNTFLAYCKECNPIVQKEKKILKKLHAEKKEKEDFKKSVANNKYICEHCGNEKFGKEMKVNSTLKRVEKICNKCNALKTKENELKRIKNMDFTLK